VFAVAAAEILVWRLSQSDVTQLTLMPLCFVNAARAAAGGAESAGSATVIVTPAKLVDAPDAVALPPPALQPAARRAMAVSPASPAAACLVTLACFLFMVLGPPMGWSIRARVTRI